jgi:hypothetical protein
MNLTFSVFGYFFSLQLFKNLFVPIERLDGPTNGSSLLVRGNDLGEPEPRQGVNCEQQRNAPILS